LAARSVFYYVRTLPLRDSLRCRNVLIACVEPVQVKLSDVGMYWILSGIDA
jgi:hypothetical protein